MRRIPWRGIFGTPADGSLARRYNGCLAYRHGTVRDNEEIHMCGNESNCGCGSVTIDSAPAADTNAGTRSTYQVSGMTCGGCANKVTGHVSEIPGVTDVQADVAAGTISVLSENPLDTAAVRAALQRAGYQLAD
ncbi:heavy-metal-associated domain-containing protein [Micromonospora sp. NPDC007271]|uniref:heavy-metal-associated domain-containing protein n=1 Tax=Micromonospora sp. NPDC007271 TaxID=3154587 RepID=UPI0033C5DC41